MSTPLVALFVVCVIGAITLAVYSLTLLVRSRKPPEVQTYSPAAVQRAAAERAAAERAAAKTVPLATSGLPGMPPIHSGASLTWATGKRRPLAPERLARGSIPPPSATISDDRFDAVRTLATPVVAPAADDAFSDVAPARLAVRSRPHR